VQQSIEVDLALIGYDDPLLTALELHSVQTAKQHDAQTRYRLQSVPGIGKILSLVLLYEIHDLQRFPRVQDFVLPFGQMCEGIRRQMVRHRGGQDR
jgi:hypothetical protein